MGLTWDLAIEVIPDSTPHSGIPLIRGFFGDSQGRWIFLEAILNLPPSPRVVFFHNYAGVIPEGPNFPVDLFERIDVDHVYHNVPTSVASVNEKWT